MSKQTNALKIQANSENSKVLELIKNGEVVKTLTLPDYSTQLLLVASDGSLIRVSTDTGILEFHKIFKGEGVTITEGEIVGSINATIEFAEAPAWLLLSYSQQRIIL